MADNFFRKFPFPWHVSYFLGGIAIGLGYIFLFLAIRYYHTIRYYHELVLWISILNLIIIIYNYIYFYTRKDKFKYEWVERFFSPFRKNKDNERIIFIYEFEKKIVFIFTPILIASTVFYIYSFPAFYTLLRQSTYFYYELIVFSQLGLIFVIYFVFLALTKPIVCRKEFSYCLARKSIEISLRQIDEDKKMYYLQYGLSSYNIYLQKALRLQIKDIDRIYEKIARSSIKDKDELIVEFLNSLLYCDRLDLVRQLGKLLPKQESTSKQENVTLLIGQKLGQRIKEVGTVIIPIVTTLITIISFFFKPIR